MLGRGHSPPHTSPPVGRGTPALPLLTPLGASIIAPLALDLWPHQTEIMTTPLTVLVSALYQTDRSEVGLINVCKELISL